ncbi:14403_t:CDS:2, partial [Racocetra fulgida]
MNELGVCVPDEGVSDGGVTGIEPRVVGIVGKGFDLGLGVNEPVVLGVSRENTSDVGVAVGVPVKGVPVKGVPVKDVEGAEDVKCI